MKAIKNELNAIKDKELECPTSTRIIKEMSKKYPNDQKFGTKVRQYLQKLKKK